MLADIDMQEALWPFASQIAEREQVLCALALARQKRVAAANARMRRAFMDGIGEVVASIDADIYHRLAATYGYDTVNSDDFLHKLLRDNPELRVRSVSRKSGIVVPAFTAEAEEQPGADICTEPQPAGEELTRCRRRQRVIASPELPQESE